MTGEIVHRIARRQNVSENILDAEFIGRTRSKFEDAVFGVVGRGDIPNPRSSRQRYHARVIFIRGRQGNYFDERLCEENAGDAAVGDRIGEEISRRLFE